MADGRLYYSFNESIMKRWVGLFSSQHCQRMDTPNFSKITSEEVGHFGYVVVFNPGEA